MKAKFSSLSSGTRLAHEAPGFSLVEVTLAIAVVAIGMVGVLGLFPLGLDAARQAADMTQMAAIAQDTIAYFQQEALNATYYSGSISEVIPSTASYTTNLTQDDIWYRAKVDVVNTGYPRLLASGTNMTTRVQIGIWRTTGSPSYTPTSKTNYYFTEVARYVP